MSCSLFACVYLHKVKMKREKNQIKSRHDWKRRRYLLVNTAGVLFVSNRRQNSNRSLAVRRVSVDDRLDSVETGCFSEQTELQCVSLVLSTVSIVSAKSSRKRKPRISVHGSDICLRLSVIDTNIFNLRYLFLPFCIWKHVDSKLNKSSTFQTELVHLVY